MNGDDYVQDENGFWDSTNQALNWYRAELARLRAIDAIGETLAVLTLPESHLSDDDTARDLDTLSDWNRLHNQDPHIKDLVQTALNEIDYLLNRIRRLQNNAISPQAGNSR